MKIITLENIQKAVEKIDELNDDALEKLSETYALQQSPLITYAISAGMETQNDQLAALSVYYFTVFSEAFVQQKISLKSISDEEIDAFQEDYSNVLEEFMDDDDLDVIIAFCNQPELVHFLAADVSLQDETGDELDDETASLLFIVGVGMIGLMNNAIKGE